ncbi:MAG TPA: FAD-dependent oxidoreductase [Cyclobacteriaceae bacterium]|nr:FAD-dependent oxidoreductase [Cyclobacteriaceae bacterium]
MQLKFDYIIVGQGLAGSCLALELLKRDKKILVFDEPAKNRSSIIAAGLFNPVTGRKMTKTWLADKLFPQLIRFYTEAEKLLQTRCLYESSVYRPFYTAEEQNEWMANSANEAYKSIIQEVHVKSTFGNDVHDAFGGLLLKQSGYLDTKIFLAAVRALLIANGAYREAHVELQAANINDKEIILADGTSAAAIIFANGLGSMQTDFFSWLPFKALKGETLSLKVEKMPEIIYNRGVYLVPEPGQMSLKAGATYDPRNLAAGITEAGRAELEESINKLIKFRYKIVDHDWGIRPSTADRKPILGKHPAFENVLIFNGLGTKGVSLAPFFAEKMAKFLSGSDQLYKEVNIERYYSLY